MRSDILKRLETERLIIRRFTKDDWKDLHEYLSNEKVVEFEPYQVFDEKGSKEVAISIAGQFFFGQYV